MTNFKLFLESPCFCILQQMIWTMHFEISFLLCYTYANQRTHWSKEMYIACNFKCPQEPLECEFFQFVCTEISKSYGQYLKSMISDAHQSKVFSVDVPNNHSLERENSNFTGGLFQGLNLYDAQVCVRVSNEHSTIVRRSRTFLRFQMLVVVMIREGPLLWEKI